MRSTFLVGFALTILAACGGSAKQPPTAAHVKPPAVKPHAAKAKAKAKKPTRKAPTPEDTATPRNPLMGH